MATADQIRRMRQQRLNTYGLFKEETPPQVNLIASGVAGPMVNGNITVFPLGVAGVVPADATFVTQRMAPGAGALGETNVDTVTPGVGGSFRIHSDAVTEVSSWQWYMYSAQQAP